ncbi:MAG TPA: hypothetical protein VFG68_15615, partial [Fimbriiglobus sp.]|nr:hypothetical protein [Fimbriiglobus sp.]
MSRQMKIRFAVMVAVCVGVVSFSTVFGLVRDVTAWLSGFSQQRRSTDKVVDVMPVLSVTTGFNTFCLAEPEQSHLAAATSKGVFQIELSKQGVVKVG